MRRVKRPRRNDGTLAAVASQVWTTDILSCPPALRDVRVESYENRHLLRGISWDGQHIYARIDITERWLLTEDHRSLAAKLDQRIRTAQRCALGIAVWSHLRNTDPPPMPGCYE